MAQPHGHSVDEYLETIYFLAFPIGEYRPSTGSTAIASRVAEMLGVSRASAGEMLKRLEADGPVEPEFEQAENAELVTLADLETGRPAEIVRLAEHDGDLLHWFYEEGLAPGTHVEVGASRPAAG